MSSNRKKFKKAKRNNCRPTRQGKAREALRNPHSGLFTAALQRLSWETSTSRVQGLSQQQWYSVEKKALSAWHRGGIFVSQSRKARVDAAFSLRSASIERDKHSFCPPDTKSLTSGSSPLPALFFCWYYQETPCICFSSASLTAGQVPGGRGFCHHLSQNWECDLLCIL